MNINKESVAVAVGTTDTILDVDVESFEELGLAIENETANALDAFEVHARFVKGGALVKLADVALDYTSPAWPIRRADDLTALAGSGTGVLFMNVAGIQSLVLKASANTTATTVNITGQCT